MLVSTIAAIWLALVVNSIEYMVVDAVAHDLLMFLLWSASLGALSGIAVWVKEKLW